MSWFVVRTKPRQEQRATEHLETQGFRVYLPILEHAMGEKEALFPGYLFLRNQAGPTPFDRVRSTRGVINCVKFGISLAVADDALIESIQNKEDEIKGKERFEHKQKVRIIDGPFRDIEAIYLARTGVERVVLLLRILNQNKEMEFGITQIESA
jgi:transcriptional antiterminator RfaH